MKKTKRIIIATLAGVLFGFVCLGFASGGDYEIPLAIQLQILISRTLIGFAIGISSLKMHWTLHGILLGFLFSLPLAFSGLMAPENPEFNASMMFISTVFMGTIYGFLVELITTVFLKLKN
ncbi:MAG: hypothetical protein V2I54_12205 [Bacteroidales bacterium]|nr:hypothetical protein [Bacteroidales bacterium]